MNKKLLKTGGLILGILAIIFAIVVFCMDTGSFEGAEFYGGDAYTGIQQAAAQSANNVKDVGAIIKVGLGSILLVHGLTFVLGALCIKTKENETAPLGSPVPQPKV